MHDRNFLPERPLGFSKRKRCTKFEVSSSSSIFYLETV